MTTHHLECTRVWKRYDPACARCQELAAGAAPRAGWDDRARAMEAARLRAIRSHDFTACADRNVVCTCFDW